MGAWSDPAAAACRPAGKATWKEELSIIATLNKDAKGKFEPKVSLHWHSFCLLLAELHSEALAATHCCRRRRRLLRTHPAPCPRISCCCPQTYEFKVQVQAADATQQFVTLGKASLDMAQHTDARAAPLALPVALAGGGTASLRISLTASAVKVRRPLDAVHVIRRVRSRGAGRMPVLAVRLRELLSMHSHALRCGVVRRACWATTTRR
jgi:hypothetical protein